MREGAVAFAVILYCALSAYPLFQAWIHSPFEKLSFIAFLLWLFPLTIKHTSRPSTLMLIGAIAATLLGTIGELNTLKYLGLALAIGSFAPWCIPMPLWLLSAATWMPLFGWVSAHFFPALAIPIKLGTVFLASLWLALQKVSIK